FMPPPRLGVKPYGTNDGFPFSDDDPFGWPVTEYQEHYELRPGLEQVGKQILHALVKLAKGDPGHGIGQAKLIGNPAWPQHLAAKVGHLHHERYVVLLPLALSRTQDDKGRVRWTLFGGSEQGPAKAFWRSFHDAPKRERPAEEALGFFRRLLYEAYGVREDR